MINRAKFKNTINVSSNHYSFEILQKTLGKINTTELNFDAEELWSTAEQDCVIIELTTAFLVEIMNGLESTDLKEVFDPEVIMREALQQYVRKQDLETIGMLDCIEIYKQLRVPSLEKQPSSTLLGFFSDATNEHEHNSAYEALKIVISLDDLFEPILTDLSTTKLLLGVVYAFDGIEDVFDSIEMNNNTFSSQLLSKKLLISCCILSQKIYNVCVSLDRQIQLIVTCGKHFIGPSSLIDVIFNAWSRSLPVCKSEHDLKILLDTVNTHLSALSLLDDLLSKVKYANEYDGDTILIMKSLVLVFQNLKSTSILKSMERYSNEIKVCLLVWGNDTVKLANLISILNFFTNSNKFFDGDIFKIFLMSIIPTSIDFSVLQLQLHKFLRKVSDEYVHNLSMLFFKFINDPNQVGITEFYTNKSFLDKAPEIQEIFNLRKNTIDILKIPVAKSLLLGIVQICNDGQLIQLLKTDEKILKKMSGDIRHYLNDEALVSLLAYILDFLFLIKSISRSFFTTNSFESNGAVNKIYNLNCIFYFGKALSKYNAQIYSLLDKIYLLFPTISLETQNPIDAWRKVNHFLFFIAMYYKVMDLIQQRQLIERTNNETSIKEIFDSISKNSGKIKLNSVVAEFALYKEKFLNSVIYYNQCKSKKHRSIVFYSLKMMQQSLTADRPVDVPSIEVKSKVDDDIEIVDRLTIELNEYKNRLVELKLQTKLKIIKTVQASKISSFQQLRTSVEASKQAISLESSRQEDYQLVLMKLKSLQSMKLFKLTQQNEKKLSQQSEYISYLRNALANSESHVNK